MYRYFSYLLLLIVPLWASAQEIPDFSANYLVQLDGIQAGELKRSLTTVSPNLRRFTSVSQAKGVFSLFKPDVIEETSLWHEVNGRVRPSQYLYERTGGDNDRYLRMDFDWSDKLVHIDDHKHPWTLDISGQTLDKLVYQLTLMDDLAAHKTSLSYEIADGGKLKTYTIDVLGKEKVTTPLGKIEAIKLMRHRDHPKDRQTTLWCAPALDYLPVKLEHVEKD
ncbi:hypothetical protein COL154_014362, partial [Colletotrichum chrysophilum]